MSSSNPLPSSFLTLLDSGRMNISPPGHCGYCESESEDEAKFSFSVNTLTILDYQALIDRGFRRSGSYIYRSELRQTCCPLLTIRLNAQNHKSNLTASQRKMMRRFNTFLERNVPDLLIKPIKTLTSSITKVIVDQEDNNMVEEKDKKEEKETIEEKLSSLVLTTAISCYGDSIKAFFRSPLLVKQLQRDNIDRTFKNSPELVKSLINLSTTLVYASPIALQLKSIQSDSTLPQSIATTICDKIMSLIASSTNSDFEILMALPSSTGHINILIKRKDDDSSIAIDSEKQTIKNFKKVRGLDLSKKRAQDSSLSSSLSSSSSSSSSSSFKATSSSSFQVPLSTSHTFTVSMVPATFDKTAYALYKEYQKVVHKDDGNTPSSYTNFLCSSPLIPVKKTGPVLPECEDASYSPLIASARALIRSAWEKGEGSGLGLPLFITDVASDSEIKKDNEDMSLQFSFDPERDGSDLRFGYGSFHLHYKIDSVLVAVGVVDVLPLCLSSVYLFYNPHLPRLELGKLTALYEIQWVQRVSRIAPRLQYWYAGLYVHSCPKMVYKRQFEPSELLCPISRQWTQITLHVIHKLDKEKVPLLITANDEAVSKSKEETKSILDTCLKSTEMLLKLEAASAAACSLKMPLLIGNVNGQWDPCVWRDLVTQLNIPEKSKDVMKSEGQKALFLLAERIGPELMKRMIISPSFLRSRRF